jgi:hypothetical protein
MSDTLLCNYCHFQDIKRRAEKDGLLVVQKRDKDGWTCIHTKKPGAKSDGKPLAMFMELTKTCAC